MVKNSIVGALLLGAGVIIGAVVMNTKVFPYRYLNAAVERAEMVYKTAVNPESAEASRVALGDTDYADTATVGKLDKEMFHESKHLKGGVVIPPGVFHPSEAEGEMLPIMSRNPQVFGGKDIMEIGTGSGIVSLYAAQLGARKVVATDISPAAIEAARANAERLGLSDIIEFRLVSLDDMSAFSAIGEDEKFDVIISNPPYALDLDAPTNTAAVDRGDLGFSIVRGLDKHLKDDGMAMLFYASMFYHEVMVRFAEYSGFDVKNHYAVGLFPWAAETLFNSYLERLLQAEGLEKDTIRFDHEKDYALSYMFLRNSGIKPLDVDYKKLLPGEKGWSYYPGMMVISRPD